MVVITIWESDTEYLSHIKSTRTNICIIISYPIPIHMCKSDSHHGQQAPMCICFYTTTYTTVDPSTGFCLHYRMFVNWFPADNVLLSLT